MKGPEMVDYGKLGTKATARVAAREDKIADILVDVNERIEYRLLADMDDSTVKAIRQLLAGKNDDALTTLGLTPTIAAGGTTDVEPEFIDIFDAAGTKVDSVRRTNKAGLDYYKSHGYANEVREHGHVIELRPTLEVKNPTEDDPEVPVFVRNKMTDRKMRRSTVKGNHRYEVVTDDGKPDGKPVRINELTGRATRGTR